MQQFKAVLRQTVSKASLDQSRKILCSFFMTSNYSRTPWRLEALLPLTPKCSRKTLEMFPRAFWGKFHMQPWNKKPIKVAGQSKICCFFLQFFPSLTSHHLPMAFYWWEGSAPGLEASSDASESLAKIPQLGLKQTHLLH